MVASIRRLLGSEEVIEKQDIIEVNGVPADVMSRDISKIWQTSRINTYMFTSMERSSFSFHKFFAIDVLFILRALLSDKKSNANKRAISRIIEKIEKNTWVSEIINTENKHRDILDFSQLDIFTLKPLPKQREFLETYNEIVPRYKLKGYLLAADPGTGKTLSGLFLAATLRADKVIIVCPKNATYEVWASTLNTRYKIKPDIWIAADEKPITRTAKYFIVHYEALGKFIDLCSEITMFNPVVILDECHHLNEITSARTANFIDLCARIKSKNILWMSGTPIKAMGSECIPLLRSIDIFWNRDVEERFKKIFGKSADRAKDILSHRLGLVMFRVEKSEMRDQEVIYYDKKVKIPNGSKYTLSVIRDEISKFIKERTSYYALEYSKYNKIYNKALEHHKATLKSDSEIQQLSIYNDYIIAIQRGYDPVLMKTEATFCKDYEKNKIMPSLPQQQRADFKNVCSIIKYVNLKIQGEALGRVLGKKRAECHVDIIAHAGLENIVDSAEKKTLIFTSYTEVLKRAKTYFENLGYRPLTVFQETNANLPAIVSSFEKDIDANPCIATYKSLSTAVPMIMANTAIMIDSPFREYIYKQAVSRLDRLGQDTQVYVYNLQLDTGEEPNISSRNVDILQWSREQVAGIMGTDVDKVVSVTVEGYEKYHEQDLDYSDFVVVIESYTDHNYNLPMSSRW